MVLYFILFTKRNSQINGRLQGGLKTMNENRQTTVKKTVKSGITFGSALAMVISYSTWQSVGWAIIHGLMSWIYVIYFILRY